MIAPDLVTLFDVESAVEPGLETVLETNLTNVAGLSVLKQRGTSDRGLPRVEVQLTLGAVEGHRFPYNSQTYFDAWNAQLVCAIFTDRSAGNPNDHARLRAQLRLFLQPRDAGKLGSTALPYHVVVKLAESGTEIGTTEKSEDVSKMKFACVVGIRSDAWPLLS